MSDSEEYEYDYGSDADSMQHSESEEENGATNIKIEAENSFYEGTDMEEDNPQEALRLFEQVIKLEDEIETAGGTSVWRFKALQHVVTISFKLNLFEQMVEKYKVMLANMQSVTRNECTDALNTVLETISNSSHAAMKAEMFKVTLDTLKTANNERLWFSTSLRLAKLYLNDLPETQPQVESLLRSLKETCTLPDGSDNPAKASNLLETYSLEIQFCRLTRNGVRMRSIYPKTLHLNAAVSDPRIMGEIREEGGKMHMSENHWDEAFDELNEAFRNFQAAGNNQRAKSCLKYVALSSMLSKTAVNPFDGREAKVYEKDPEIVAMKELRVHLHNNDLEGFEKVLTNKSNGIMNEEVLMTYLELLRRRMKEHVLVNMIRPYKKVTLEFLSKQLYMTVEQVESMLVDMIQQGEIDAVINQIDSYLLKQGEVASDASKLALRRESVPEKKAKALGRWADALSQISDNLVSQLT